MSPRSNRKTSTWSAVNFKKHVTSMSAKLEPAISPRNTGQRILCFDRCHLIIAWTSNIKEVHGKPRLYVSGDLGLLFGRHVARLRRRRRRAYAPMSNTACHENHEKINSWVSFAFLYVFEYGAPLGDSSGRPSSAMKSALKRTSQKTFLIPKLYSTRSNYYY